MWNTANFDKGCFEMVLDPYIHKQRENSLMATNQLFMKVPIQCGVKSQLYLLMQH